MILQDLVIPSKRNLRLEYSGLDSLEHCLNKDHFRSYPHPVQYHYNSRGFRDAKWPESLEELKNAIWCVGDSFTVGIGSPYNFTWPQVLSTATGRRCINISMDGASNTWISRRAQQIVREVAPAHMVVMWSYLHRDEAPDINLPDEDRRLQDKKYNSDLDNLKNFIDCYTNLKNCTTNTRIFNGIIPNSGPDLNYITKCWHNIKDSLWPEFPPTTLAEFNQLPAHIKQETTDVFSNYKLKIWFLQNYFYKHNQLLKLSNLDYARDYHHFDYITSKFFVDQILKDFNS